MPISEILLNCILIWLENEVKNVPNFLTVNKKVHGPTWARNEIISREFFCSPSLNKYIIWFSTVVETPSNNFLQVRTIITGNLLATFCIWLVFIWALNAWAFNFSWFDECKIVRKNMHICIGPPFSNERKSEALSFKSINELLKMWNGYAILLTSYFFSFFHTFYARVDFDCKRREIRK